MTKHVPDRHAVSSHRYCLMCGCDNPLSFGLDFKLDSNNIAAATFRPDENLQGYQGIVHGGVLSALLDTAMAQCLLKQNIEALTGELTIRFYQPVACNSLLSIRAWVDSSLPPLFHLRAEILVDDRLACKARAKFMQR
ncbi:PaaI family thioesterase [Desulforhopalus singaporensis]|uniref:Acyl-coenzyme A thioesterase THEM4 n=1 Tax=Desulforhopalus singaporensis TaxID=91360 RepID=A0A1H0IZZ5_9BACT|nr:PaaI family thioesterase [Desulforhopalus singaporensis]SDO36701.1 uncharacterized domain 1-containing protein [Desulforhopalus singaporensis]